METGIQAKMVLQTLVVVGVLVNVYHQPLQEQVAQA
jgi:hypothetical protein